LCRKTGNGRYDYEAGWALPSSEVAAILVEESVRAGRSRRAFDAAEIMDRILSTMKAEGIVESANDIDAVTGMGFGLPRHRGGPMHLAVAG